MVTPGTPPVPHVGGPIMPPGLPTVLIGGMPAATLGNICTCVGPPDSIIKGSAGVFIGGKPAARMGDTTAHGGVIAAGMITVLIGEAGSHHIQQQDYSCVIASSRNLILMLTGEDIPEAQLRDEMRKIMNSPAHDFNISGINPAFAAILLSNHGVPNSTEIGTSLDRLDQLTQNNPVLVGFPGHRVMLDTVITDEDGNRTYVVRDPAPSYDGQPRNMTEEEFNETYNDNAIVIVPDQ
jgi:uncharacterized Zn-binding protein involved in type VI secretion